MSALDSAAPPNPATSNGNLPAIQYLPHPPSDLGVYHPQQSPMGHIAPLPPSTHTMQQPNAYLPQPSAYMPPNAHYSTQPGPYDTYPPPPHQSPYAVPHFPPHSPHPPSPYGHHFQSEYHHDPFQYVGPFRNYVTDPSGQQGPPGMKPRVTTTLWEDEGTLCFQVEAKGICVARREDNNMINGTKLLNVAGMSRGKRDGILKSEKQRAVVKVGAMHLKGVWIPFERALDFANKERIIDQLYPLFVQDIKSFLYHPANYARTSAVMAAAAHRQTQSTPNATGTFNQPSSTVPRRGSDAPTRPSMSERSMSFPTPPSSASSITNGTADLPWVSHTGLTLDTSVHPVTRSLPGTPATSPSSAVHASSQTYGALTDSHINRQSISFEPSSFKREAVSQLHLSYPSNSQFSSRRASSASEMGPPPQTIHSRLSTIDKDPLETKHDALPEAQEEGYQNDLQYSVPPSTPISTSNSQVYGTPSVVAMKGRVDTPNTPTHGSPSANSVNWSSKHETSSQNEYSVSSQSHHTRQLSYQIRGSDDQPHVNGVNRNIFDPPVVDREPKLSLDYNHGDEVLSNELPNGHSLSHGPLPSIKQEVLIKDGPPSTKRRRTINQDSLPYGLGGPSPNQSTADLTIPEGSLSSNGNVLNSSDPAPWSMSSSYADDYGTTVLGDPPVNGRKRPPSQH